MTGTGDEYRDSIRNNREVCMNGEKAKDRTAHPSLKPLLGKAL